LIYFDYRTTDEKTLLVKLQQAWDALRAEYERVQAPATKASPRDASIHPAESQSSAASSLMRVGVRGLVGHAAVDSLWFAAALIGESFGLPLAGLGMVHVFLDIAVCGMALCAGLRPSVPGKPAARYPFGTPPLTATLRPDPGGTMSWPLHKPCSILTSGP
jgi:hypothetical protein